MHLLKWVKAKKKNGGWVLNGQKSAWVSNGPVATNAAVFANMAERCHKAVQGKDSEALIAEIHRQASPYFLEYAPKPEV